MKRSKWKKHGKVNNAREGIFFIKLFIISEIIMKIDFTRNPRLLTEGWLSAFGEWNKTILKYIYGKDWEEFRGNFAAQFAKDNS